MTGAAVGLAVANALLGVAATVVALAARTLHLALGALLVVGVIVHLVLSVLGVPLVLAALVAVAVGAVLGAALGPGVVAPLRRGAAGEVAVLAGLALAGVLLEAGAGQLFAARQLRPDPLLPAGPAVTATLLGVPLVAAVAGLLTGTGWGARLRLVGGSSEAARTVGIGPVSTVAGAFAASGALAVAAGLLVAPVTFAGLGQGAGFTLRGIAAATVLGVGGPGRAVAGGVLLGVVEALAGRFAPGVGGTVAVAAVIVVVVAARGGELVRAWGRPW